MKKHTLSWMIGAILPVIISVFLCLNYVNTVNGGVRIPSELGYYLFLIVVVVSSILFALTNKAPNSLRSTFKKGLVINLMFLVYISLDMALHVVARAVTHSQNTSAVLPGGIQQYIPLIQAAWGIYGIRFITVLLIGNLTFWAITKSGRSRSH